MFIARPRLTILAFLAICFCLSGLAFADPNSVNMTFIGPAGNNAGGVYTYPYNFSINGSTTSTPLICDAYDNEVTPGESWQATVNPLLSGSGMFGNNLADYEAAAIIYAGILNGTISANAGNFAIWGLFSTNAQNNPFFQSSGAASIEQWALSQIGFYSSSWYANFVLYTPLAGTQSSGGIPQEYMGMIPAPEPGTMLLLGTGLAALGTALRKKLCS
jgi:hypothetical protein